MEFSAKMLEKNDTALVEEFYINSGNQADLNINLKLDHSPDIWDSFAVLGYNQRVLAVIENNKRHVACACAVSLKKCYIRGALHTVGYMSSMKVRKEYRGSLVLSKFMKLFNSYWEETKPVCWFISVFSDNNILINLLNNKHLLLPEIEVIATYNTYIFKSGLIKLNKSSNNRIDVRRANKDDLKAIYGFLQREYIKRDLIPDYSLEEIAEGTGLLKGFLIQNMALAFRNGDVAGMLGLWDQSDYRRWLVESYSLKYKLAKPFLNILAKLTKMPPLPKSGESISYKMISLLLIENDNAEIFKLLYQEIAKQTLKNDLISVGIIEQNPLNTLFNKNCIKLQNNIYLGYWQEYKELVKGIRKRNIYIEQGGL